MYSTKQTKILTDGSKVYNVCLQLDNGTHVMLFAKDEKNADAMSEALDDCVGGDLA